MLMRPIRVLCVFGELNRGGAETMCMNLYRNINRNIVQFDFVKHTFEVGCYEEEIKQLGGEIYTAPKYCVFNHFEYDNWWRRHLREHPEHVIIHAHYITMAAVYLAIAKKNGRVTIAHSHSTNPRGSFLSQIIKRLYIVPVARVADYRLSCSLPAGECVFGRKEFSVLKNAIEVERFRFDPSIRDSIRKQWRLEDCFVLGTVGSITKVKNPFGLLDIFERVYRKNSGARLLWVGEGDLREEIEELVQARGLQGVVHFTGMREDVECMMQAMDVFVFPSLWEGLGMAVIEAQAAGLTCVCSDNVPREVNVSGLCSFFSLGQIEQWVNCIMAISGKRQDMTEIVRKAGYDVRDTGKKMEAFYCEINESMRTEVRCS